MSSTRLHRVGVAAIFVSGLLAAAAVAGPLEVQGMCGVRPVNPSTAIAFWVPIDSGQVVAGVRWYNNDSYATFPVVMGVAGDGDRPEVLSAAVQLAAGVSGESLGWVDLYFDTAVTSATAGLYLIFKMPAGDGYMHEGSGGGPGIGYCAGGGVVSCWLTADGATWHPIGAEHRIAAEPIFAVNKSMSPLVLGVDVAPSRSPQATADLAAVPSSLVAVPNPCNPMSEIRFSLAAPADVALDIFDVRGRKVKTCFKGSADAGDHQSRWDGSDDAGRIMPSGVYLVRLRAGAREESMRLTLVR
jgi:hypothetical protein